MKNNYITSNQQTRSKNNEGKTKQQTTQQHTTKQQPTKQRTPNKHKTIQHKTTQQGLPLDFLDAGNPGDVCFLHPSIHVPRNGKAQKVHVGCAWPQRVVTLHFLRSNRTISKTQGPFSGNCQISRSIWGGNGEILEQKTDVCLTFFLIISQDNDSWKCSHMNPWNLLYNCCGWHLSNDEARPVSVTPPLPDRLEHEKLGLIGSPHNPKGVHLYFNIPRTGKILETSVVNLTRAKLRLMD